MKKTVFYFGVSLAALIFIFLFQNLKLNDHKLHVVICNVGQGDAIFITTPSQTQILIDGGPDKKVLDCLAHHMPFWDRSIDAVILTHPHADHMTGLIDVIQRYHLYGFYTEGVSANSDTYQLLEAKLADKEMSAKDLLALDNFKDKSGVEIKILWPRHDTIKESDHNIANLDLNGLSVVALLTYGNFSVLLTGDAGKNVMDQIASEAGDIDILKVPHHGSRTGMDGSFLSAVKPEIAVISVGAKNKFGHPAPQSLKLLESQRVKVFRTDQNGEVEILSNGNTYNVASSR